MKADWKKVGTECLENGEKTILYANPAYPGLVIESRKRNIPHSGREGTWSHTSYVLVRGPEELTFYSLGDAVKWAEETPPAAAETKETAAEATVDIEKIAEAINRQIRKSLTKQNAKNPH